MSDAGRFVHHHRREAWFEFEIRDAIQPLGQKRIHLKACQVHAQASVDAAAECPVALAQDLSFAAPSKSHLRRRIYPRLPAPATPN